MGVPKFYRWLSERYPCLSQVIKEHQIPEFDNLYLDMNGIIHPCSHPNDDDPHFRITEAEIFKNIFNYIEVLFRIIKPKKNFFMAVDGCAPRAKMNQQRSRRFRTAKEAEDNIRKALLKGQTLPTEDRFDSNCITPGTEFMARLQVQLKYFVNKKISTDPMWQQCSVYLSGHDVPGEGEHKVMDFIRYCKSKPGYDPNTRHCLYGLDADLIMLGLTSHEPHFALLREEVRFGKQSKRLTRPEQQTFHLLHLSLMREYIDFEFGSLKPSLHFRYDLERLIDDWIFLSFLVGNDFIPHLPHMHINHDALPYLFGVYKEFLPTTDGYLNNGGDINLHRLKKFFETLSKFDRDRFEEVYADLKWLESKGAGNLLKSGEKGSPEKKKFSKFLVSLDEDEFLHSPDKAPKNVNGNEDGDGDGDDVEVEDEETFELEFKQHKRHYYMEKFDMDIVDDDQIHTICYEYVRALQWNAHYYFNGLQSWSWYYPYHYSPYISDVANFDIKELHFDMGKPFHPFEQLLAVLPAASRKLLPVAFQHLMVMDNSPIIDFYPTEFRTDLNGKQQEWEAVVLIPFIDEGRLLRAMLPNYAHLTDEEKERNSFGKCFVYKYDKTLNFVYASSYPDHFDDISMCKAKAVELDREHFHLDMGLLKKGLMKGTLLDVYFHGFPTMKQLKHESYLKKAGVKVFQQNSRNNNMIVKIIPGSLPSIEEIAKHLLGETAYVEWPYMVEAIIKSVCDDSIRYYLDGKNQLQSKMLGGEEYKSVVREMKAIETYHMGRRGIELGEVKVMVEANLLLGKRYVCGHKGSVKLQKEWSPRSSFYPYQAVVQDLSVNVEQCEVFDSIENLYPAGSNIFMMASPHYGSPGEVIECDKEAGRVRVALKVDPEPDFTSVISKYDSLSIHYISDHAVSRRLGIATQLLGRITGDVYIYEREEYGSGNLGNIGLRLKYSGQNKEALGFARRAEKGWTYPPATIAILEAYMKKYPEVFEALGRTTNHEQYVFSKLFPKKDKKYLEQIKTFLKSQPCHNVQHVRCGSNVLDEPVVQKIEREIERLEDLQKERKIVKVKLKPFLLFRSTEQFGKLSPDPHTEFLLLDRVVNVQNGITVPLGLKGTIVGIHQVLTDENDKNSATETRYEVLYDKTFLGAMPVRSKEKRGYFMLGYSLLNISYGERKEKKKKGVPLSSPMSFQSKITQSPASSPYNSKRSDAFQTPTKIYGKSPSQKSQSAQGKSAQKEELVSPDYWLKGSYSNKKVQPTSTPPQRQQRQSGNTPIQIVKNSPQQIGANNDFMNMWQEMKKNESPSPRHPQHPQQGVDQNATAVIHQMLHIDSQPSTQSYRQQPQQQAPSLYQPTVASQNSFVAMLHQICLQSKLPPPKYVYSETQQGTSALVLIGPTIKCSGGMCTTRQLAAESAASVTLMHLSQLHPSLRGAPQILSPIRQLPVSSPLQFHLTPVPVGGRFQQPQFHPFPSSQQRPRQLYQSPGSFGGATPKRHNERGFQPRQSYSQGHISQRPHSNDAHMSKSDSKVNSSASRSKNPFIPHQVVMKNKQSMDNARSLNSENADREIKDILGMPSKDDELKNLIGVPTTGVADIQGSAESVKRGEELKTLLGISPRDKDEQLKDLIGVGKVDGDDYLKNILGVKPVSDDDKLKEMLGMNDPVEESTSDTDGEEEGEGEEDEEVLAKPLEEEAGKTEEVKITDDKFSEALVGMLSLCKIAPNSSPTPDSTSSESKDNSPSSVTTKTIAATQSQSSPEPAVEEVAKKSVKKPQILLAPSFFGPKKK